MAPVHGVSEQIEPKEHGLVCNVLPHGLIDDNLRPEENPLQAILHSERWRLGDLVDNEIYRPRGQVTQDIEHSRWGRQQNPSLVCFYVSYQNSMVSRDVKEQRPSSRVKLK